MALTKVSGSIIGTETVTNDNISDTVRESFGIRNRIINGDMRIDQRNNGASVTLTGSAQFVVDRFNAIEDTDGGMTGQQDTSAPIGFVNSIKFTTTTADASLAASQIAALTHRIEGLNVADLAWGTANAKTITLSFWVRSSLTGTFGGALQNSANNRSYPFTYSISVADTWEQKSVTIAGDTTGTWLTTNGIGISIRWGLGMGSDYNGTADAWVAADKRSVTSSVSVIGTLNATWYITGVQLEVGSVATPFERRPYGTELSLCQRYYFKIIGNAGGGRLGVGYNSSTTVAVVITSFPVAMRIAPSALEQSGTAANYDVQHLAVATTCSSVPAFNSSTEYTASSLFTVASGLTAGQGSSGRGLNTSAYLAWSAEL